MCFTTSVQKVARCELCLGTKHAMADCTLQGEPGGGVTERMWMMEAMLLALATRQQLRRHQHSDGVRSTDCLTKSGHYRQCKRTHEWSQCQEPHPATHC